MAKLVPSFALIAMSIVPRLLGFEGLAYTAGAFVLSIAFTYYAIKCVANKTNAGARLLLMASILHLPLIFLLMVVDRV